MAKDFLSDLEAICLAAVLNCNDNAYGMTIHEEVERMTAGLRSVVLGTVYTTLDRLEEKGYVKSWFAGATEERGGRSKRYFEVTGSGKTALKNSYNQSERTFDGAEKWGWNS